MRTNLKTSINTHQAKKKIKFNSLDLKKLIINFLANIILKKNKYHISIKNITAVSSAKQP